MDQEHDVGIFGGIKLGYVFGTGLVRPTIEGDFFYNGFNFGGDFTLRDQFGDVLAQDNVSRWVNSGAFMVNFILRFNFGRFQPYAGAGVGAYYAEAEGFEFQNVPLVGKFNTRNLSYADLGVAGRRGLRLLLDPKVQHVHRIPLSRLHDDFCRQARPHVHQAPIGC